MLRDGPADRHAPKAFQYRPQPRS